MLLQTLGLIGVFPYQALDLGKKDLSLLLDASN